MTPPASKTKHISAATPARQPRWGGSPVSLVAVAAIICMVGYAYWREGRQPLVRWVPAVGTPGAPSTSRDDLDRSAAELRAKLRTKPRDGAVAVSLASVLLRQARVKSDATLALEAERHLRTVIEENPADYDAHRMLGAVLLSQHRFRDAVQVADQARRMNPNDAWNYGVAGDGHLELGEYDEAVSAYEKMMQLRPSAQAYARMSHLFETQGRLTRALDTMLLAQEATSAHDPESQAWHAAQIGQLYFQMGRLDDAEREYRRAAFIFPDHPYALTGIARVLAARHDYQRALSIVSMLMERVPTPELAAQMGDLYMRLGDTALAEPRYAQAEQLERDGWRLEEPQPGALARFLAERNRKIDVAVEMAERAAASRQDIFTEDALAWAYFRAGRLEEALAASARALRTGTRDRRILYHAAAIRHAVGDDTAARRFIDQSLDGMPTFDLVNGPAAAALRDRLTQQVQGVQEVQKVQEVRRASVEPL